MGMEIHGAGGKKRTEFNYYMPYPCLAIWSLEWSAILSSIQNPEQKWSINKSWLFDFLFLWLALTTRNVVSAAKPVQETGRILRRLSPAWTLLCFTAQQNCQPVNASNASMSMGAGVTAIIVIYTSKKCICGFRRMGSHLTIRILTSLDFTEW